jgi:hypothetical protein
MFSFAFSRFYLCYPCRRYQQLGKDGEGATTKRRGATTTKTMSQDDTDTNNEGTDNNNNNNNNGNQGMKTNNEEFNDDNHKTMTGTETETDNDNHMTKMAAAVHDEHGTRSEGPGNGYSAVQQGMQKGPKRRRQRLLGCR